VTDKEVSDFSYSRSWPHRFWAFADLPSDEVLASTDQMGGYMATFYRGVLSDPMSMMSDPGLKVRKDAELFVWCALSASLRGSNVVVCDAPSYRTFSPKRSLRLVEAGIQIAYLGLHLRPQLTPIESDPVDVDVASRFMAFQEVQAIYGYKYRSEDRYMVIILGEKHDEELLLRLIDVELSLRDSYSSRLVCIEYIPANVARDELVHPSATLLFERFM
jgi:hypothetical protein